MHKFNIKCHDIEIQIAMCHFTSIIDTKVCLYHTAYISHLTACPCFTLYYIKCDSFYANKEDSISTAVDK